MKRIRLVTNNLICGGVENALIDIANCLCEKYEVEVVILFKASEENIQRFDKRIKVRVVFDFYFRGFSRILKMLPGKLLYDVVIKDKKNTELDIAFQAGVPTKMMAYSKKKKIAWMHGYDDTGVKYHVRYDRICFVSDEVRRQFEKLVPEYHNTCLVYNLIDTDEIHKKAEEESGIRKNEEKIFITVGRLDPMKGVDRLIRALACIKKEGGKFKFYIIGDGDIMPSLKELVRQKEMDENIIFLGYQKNPYKYLHNADWYLCGSYAEGLSISVTEALVLEVPVLTTNVFGMHELMGKDGGIIVENTEEALLEGLKKIMEDRELDKQYHRSVKKLKGKFDLSERKKVLMERIEEVI